MAQRSTQQDKYAIDFQTDISTAVECSSGVDTDKSGITIFNHSPFYVNQTYIDGRKTVKSASRNILVEYQNTTTTPATSLQVMLSPKDAYPPLRLFFQRGCLQDTTDSTIKWFFPYSYMSDGSTCETWATIVRDLSSGETESHRLVGSIATNLSFAVNASEYITLATRFNSRSCELDYNSSGDNFTLSTDSPLLWRNSVTQMGDSYSSSETLDLKAFSLEVNNNAVGKKFNSAYIQRFILGSVTGRGAITIPWDNSSTSFLNNVPMERFMSGNVNRLSIYFGNQYVNTGSTLSLNLLVRYSGGAISSDSEVSNDMPFILVEDASFSSDNGKISTWSIDSASADTISFAFTGTETLTGNVFPGDVVLTLDATSGSNDRWIVEKILSSSSLTLTENHSAGVGATGTNATIIRQPINIGLNDKLNRSIS